LPLARFWRHSTQRFHCILYRLAPIRRQLRELRMKLPRLLLLLRSQMFPGFHAVQNQLLTLRRQAVEVL
jgi:hypothetical protein